ncbi:iron-siderophore ABC transporter substrate-binding protein [Amaricoccus solimangrovi]|uniref:Iron-siderophore ABC transporter substrate-binding protein n=1 Tax=Amaricoccus solimangrovi TaxID=2589815 RepID=A0A501WRF1_9RHOB|nr:iron-siderophore ABC transporter substrate-binding protein [Amaricoccus solimangrovi]TPE49581.1 iron-siderophore ABC transporter substrate-binding protein [Amaricoccus solimangrovi]
MALSRRALLAGAGALVIAPPVRAAGSGVRFRHVFGEIELAAPATRVVSLGSDSHDVLLALGVAPLAIRSWYGDYPYGVWPWAQPLLGDAEPVVIGGEISAETVASLAPDLIVGIGSGMSREEYDLLSRIAPVLMQEPGTSTYGTSWQTLTRTLGRAVGKDALAADLIADLERRFSETRARHPEWEGRTAVAVWQDSGQTGVYTDEDTRPRFLRELGFRPPEAVAALPSFDGFYAIVSSEDFSPIDADLVIWISGQAHASDIAALPMRGAMRARREGREIPLEEVLTGALSFGTILSLPFALREMEPLIVLALDGDPATPVPPAVETGLAP